MPTELSCAIIFCLCDIYISNTYNFFGNILRRKNIIYTSTCYCTFWHIGLCCCVWLLSDCYATRFFYTAKSTEALCSEVLVRVQTDSFDVGLSGPTPAGTSSRGPSGKLGCVANLSQDIESTPGTPGSGFWILKSSRGSAEVLDETRIGASTDRCWRRSTSKMRFPQGVHGK